VESRNASHTGAPLPKLVWFSLFLFLESFQEKIKREVDAKYKKKKEFFLKKK